jgi:hypothetical protein
MRGLRAVAGRCEGKLNTAVLLLGLCAAVVVPQDVIWCRGSAGHNALESAWSACCAPTDSGRSCATWTAPRELAAEGASLASGVVQCADLWIGSIGAAPPRPPSPLRRLHATAAIVTAPLVSGGPVRPRGARGFAPYPRQARELISTTVQTI